MPKPIKQTCVDEPFFICSCGKQIYEKSQQALDRKKRLHFKANGCNSNPNIESRDIGTVRFDYGFDIPNINVQGLAVALARLD